MQQLPLNHEPKTDTWDVVSEMIDGVLKEIQSKQLALQTLEEGDYDFDIVQQQLGHLTSLISRTQKLLGELTQLDSVSMTKLDTKVNSVHAKLEELLARTNEVDSPRLEKRQLRKSLYEIIVQLDIVLKEMSIDLESEAQGELPEVIEGTQHELISMLTIELEEFKTFITLGDLGQSLQSKILYQLHRLTLQLYRLRRLAAEPRLKDKQAQLISLARQIQDIVGGLNIDSVSVVELLEENLEVLERQLARIEHDRNFGFIPLRLSWFINRYRDVTGMKSAQSRILVGLGFSFTISGFVMIALMLPLTLVSTWATTTKDNMRQKLNSELMGEVNALLSPGNLQDSDPIQRVNFDDELTKIDEMREIILQLVSVKADVLGSGENGNLDQLQTLNQGIEALDQQHLKGLKATIRSFEQEQLSLQGQIQTFASRQQANREKINNVLTKIDALSDWDGQNGLGDGPLLTSDQQKQLTGELSSWLDKNSLLSGLSLDQRRQLKQNISIAIAKKTNQSLMRRVIQSLANFINNESFLNHSRRILLAAFAGAIGSMMSILIRLDQIDQEHIKNPFLLGALKPLIGAVFGVAVFAILSTRVIDILPSSFNLHEPKAGVGNATQSHSELTFPNRDPLGDIDSQELYKIFLLAFIAGFSERLASDTLRSVSSNKGF